MKIHDLILASQSKIRREILEISQIPFRVCPSDIDEKKITCESSRSLAQKRAIAKAKDLANKNPGSVVIGCDQVLSFENKVFSKPKSPEEAFEQLKNLQGKEHWLYSAVALYYGQKSQSLELAAWVSPVKMQMHPLCDDLIREYVSTREWQGSVGGYKIEGKGRALFASFEPREDKSVIMGLPLPELLQKMRELGLYHPETGLASVLN